MQKLNIKMLLAIGAAGLGIAGGVFAQDAPSAMPMPAGLAPPPPPPAQAPSIAEPEDESHIDSLFFTPEEMAALRKALSLYNSSAGVPDELKEIPQYDEAPKKEDAAVPKTYVYPQFYLQSLEYHTPQQWVVRMNNRKFTPDSPPDATIRIVSLDKDKVTFLWKPSDIGRVQDAWASAPKSDLVRFETTTNTVTFTLHHNQTFSAYLMRVLEGAVTPVEVVLNGPQDRVKSPLGSNSDKAVRPGPAGPSEGLGALLDSYKPEQQEKPKP